MATWRRKLLALFPDLRVRASESEFTPYAAFLELLPRCRNAHERNDEQELASIYAFAEWCVNQKAGVLWNSAGVCFYEHLFDMPRLLWPEIVAWLSPNVVSVCRGLWECRLTSEECELIELQIRSCKTRKYSVLEARFKSV